MAAGQCPDDAQWWTCSAQNPTFFGCCTSDPCNGVGCPHDDLRPMRLSSSGQSMSSNSSCKAGGEWWECQLSVPTFQGCCTANPCNSNGRCSRDDLRPASFASTGKDDDDDKSSASKGPSTIIYTTGVVSIVSEGGANARPTTILVTTTASSNPSTITTSVTPQIPQDTHHNPGKVAGIAVGAVAGVLLLVGAIAGITKWRQKRRRERIGYPRLSGGPGDLGGNVDVAGAKGGSGGVMDDADPDSNHRAYVDKL